MENKSEPASKPALVGIIMGSQSDWQTMKESAALLKSLGIPFETEIVSAHRTPNKLYAYAESAQSRGLQVIIAGAGGAAHLPGMTAAITQLPVLGVPVESKALSGQDSLLSIVQMPAGIPVMTLAIGIAGAKNAALSAASIIALNDATLGEKLKAFREAQTQTVLDTELPNEAWLDPEHASASSAGDNLGACSFLPVAPWAIVSCFAQKRVRLLGKSQIASLVLTTMTRLP